MGFNIILTLFRQVLMLVVSLILMVLIARELGPEAQGKYALAILLPTFLANFLNLGLPSANAYFLGRGDFSALAALKSSLLMWRYILLLGLGTGALTVAYFSESFFPAIEQQYLWIALVFFPFVLLHQLLASILHGLESFSKYNWVLFILPFSNLVLALLALYFLGWGLAGTISAFGLAHVLTVIIAWKFIRQEITLLDIKQAVDCLAKDYLTPSIRYGWKAYIANVLGFLNYRSSILLLNLFLTPVAVGLYFVAYGMAEKIWMVSQAVSTVVLPRLSGLSNDGARRHYLTALSIKLVFLVSAVLAIIVFFVASPLITILFGDAYSDAVTTLQWLLPGMVLGAAGRGLSIDLAARNRVDLNIYLALALVAWTILGSIILIPLYGISGAAMAVSLAYFFDLCLRLLTYSKVTKENVFDLMSLNKSELSRVWQDLKRLSSPSVI